jgi:diphthine synthase
MSELWFVGLGLDDERGLSARALEVLHGSELFAEEYTALASPGTLERIGRAVGRPVQKLDRAAIEGEASVLAALARSASVALLVVGDPFAATTHVALRLAAEKAGHSWRYLPNASILSAAAGFLGLMHYRFGRPVSLPFPDPRFAPTSPLERIRANRELDLHTLVLLDLAPESGRFLSAGEALGVLRERDPEGAVLTDDEEVAVAARVGRDDAAAFVGPVRSLRGRSFGPPMHCVVVLARTLHFEENAALERFRLRPTV